MSSAPSPAPEEDPRFQTLAGVNGVVLRVCVLRQRVLSLKATEAIVGWRFSALVLDAAGPVRVASLDWRDAEQVDHAVIEHAAGQLAGGAPPPLCFLPASFSTLSSTSGRRALSERLQAITESTERRVVLEAHGLAGVPAPRLAEVVAHIRPACAGVIAEVSSDRAELAAIGHCGFAGFLVRTQTAWSADPGQLARFQALTELARGSAPICMARATEDDLPVLAAAGFTHAAAND